MEKNNLSINSLEFLTKQSQQSAIKENNNVTESLSVLFERAKTLKQDKQSTVYIYEAQKKKLETLKNIKGLSMTRIISALIDDFIDKNKEEINSELEKFSV